MKRALLFSFRFPFLVTIQSCDPAKLTPSNIISRIRHFTTSIFTILYGLKILSPYTTFSHHETPRPEWGGAGGGAVMGRGRGCHAFQ
jgi:hypothetical protein